MKDQQSSLCLSVINKSYEVSPTKTSNTASMSPSKGSSYFSMMSKIKPIEMDQLESSNKNQKIKKDIGTNLETNAKLKFNTIIDKNIINMNINTNMNKQKQKNNQKTNILKIPYSQLITKQQIVNHNENMFKDKTQVVKKSLSYCQNSCKCRQNQKCGNKDKLVDKQRVMSSLVEGNLDKDKFKNMQKHVQKTTNIERQRNIQSQSCTADSSRHEVINQNRIFAFNTKQIQKILTNKIFNPDLQTQPQPQNEPKQTPTNTTHHINTFIQPQHSNPLLTQSQSYSQSSSNSYEKYMRQINTLTSQLKIYQQIIQKMDQNIVNLQNKNNILTKNLQNSEQKYLELDKKLSKTLQILQQKQQVLHQTKNNLLQKQQQLFNNLTKYQQKQQQNKQIINQLKIKTNKIMDKYCQLESLVNLSQIQWNIWKEKWNAEKVCYLEKIVKLEGIVLRERNVVVDGERKRGSYDEGVHRQKSRQRQKQREIQIQNGSSIYNRNSCSPSNKNTKDKQSNFNSPTKQSSSSSNRNKQMEREKEREKERERERQRAKQRERQRERQRQNQHRYSQQRQRQRQKAQNNKMIEYKYQQLLKSSIHTHTHGHIQGQLHHTNKLITNPNPTSHQYSNSNGNTNSHNSYQHRQYHHHHSRNSSNHNNNNNNNSTSS